MARAYKRGGAEVRALAVAAHKARAHVSRRGRSPAPQFRPPLSFYTGGVKGVLMPFCGDSDIKGLRGSAGWSANSFYTGGVKKGLRAFFAELGIKGLRLSGAWGPRPFYGGRVKKRLGT
jgi:hypothetical protein